MCQKIKYFEFKASGELSAIEIESLYSFFDEVAEVSGILCIQSKIQLAYNTNEISETEIIQFITDLGIVKKGPELAESIGTRLVNGWQKMLFKLNRSMGEFFK
ncbi:hypothetical protein ACXR6G_06820 [Ancylomarina sp. YFZ004]